ncbi:PREDICTED: serine--pyruvate aminotransferase, mitochondrial [Polistes canadensis]|uniref:serine--pyruvate aminotransferase, mitochondrial n=1 Tax=Polistes canadensis TaxID=91411 RepID=UPI000718DC34|nr:PREDICTED: serine--pyruvate aminotransferase, mitochondrial [Polistes canadensis]XP_014609232.1 PREDICTED: serine--pyruvate aminotransferase, mitochondrial [Polistes canadensis]
MEVDPPKEFLKPLEVPYKILMGPGPSNCSQRVLQSLGHQIIGHLYPEMFKLMDDIKAGIQYAFQTKNKLTLALSTAAHGGMEACLGNLIESGETVLIAKCGIWGKRAGNMANRIGAHVEFLKTEHGVGFDLDLLESFLKRFKPAAVFVVHAESSTGMKQPLEGVGNLVHRYNSLLIVDCVASLGGEPFFADAWEIDAVYSCSQKVLGAPPGITPISFSPLAVKKIFGRRTKISTYYWDMTILGDYWNCFGNSRIYHHTMSATLVYGLREALAELIEEGLVSRWSRHKLVAAKLREELSKRGFRFYVKDPKFQLSTIVSIEIPLGIDIQILSARAMERYGIEISGGLGPTVGKIIRIGLMGNNSTYHHVDLLLDALDDSLKFAIKSKI